MAYHKGACIIGFTPSFVPFRVLFQFVMLLVRVVDWLLYRIQIEGRENLRDSCRAVLVSNHTLVLDPGVIAHAIRPRRTYFTMLEETALIPYLGTFVRLLGGIPIPESAGALRSLGTAADTALRTLGLIHFFPEGECYQWSQELAPFHPGAFLLACRLRLPVIPITTVLRERRWFGRSSFRVGRRTIRLLPLVKVVIGEPVDPRSAGALAAGSLRGSARELAERVRGTMQRTIDRERGSKSLYRGMLPRLVRQAAPDAELSSATQRPA